MSTYASYNKTDFEKRIGSIEKHLQEGTISSHNALIRLDIETLKKQLINKDCLLLDKSNYFFSSR